MWKRIVSQLTMVVVALVVVLSGCGGKPPDARVIFIGSSTVQLWPTYADFPARNWVAFGVAGENSTQVKERFQRDVIDQHPHAVHLLCGVNDMSQDVPEDVTVANWDEMITAAQAAGIQVYIGTLQPFGTSAANLPRNKAIVQINARMKALAAAKGATVVDYHSVLVSVEGLFENSLTDDGLHPNAAGFKRMTDLADATLRP